jgi:hypothetical protein
MPRTSVRTLEIATKVSVRKVVTSSSPVIEEEE